MLRITKQTDYGVLVLAHLASLPAGQIVCAREAARATALPVPTVSKIFKSLARGHLVESHRGVGGGYSLARPLDQTSLAALIRALEGPISMVECGARPGLCSQEPTCPVRVTWARVNREIERALERVPLSAMLGGPAKELLGLGPESDDLREQRGLP
jgi:FeS assembly SUF system regulator